MRTEVAYAVTGMAAQLQHAAYVVGGALAVVAIVCFVAYWLVWR